MTGSGACDNLKSVRAPRPFLMLNMRDGGLPREVAYAFSLETAASVNKSIILKQRKNNDKRNAMKKKQKKSKLASMGLDFGTESVRALIVSLDGKELGCGVSKYKHGQITKSLPGLDKPLPPDYALQHPDDWVQSAAKAVKSALREASLDAENIIGVGVDFTSCTMLPTFENGEPLCLQKRFAKEPMAWPKLWKHHGAHEQTQRINRVATERAESFLASYGGIIGLEWMFPKILETLEKAPRVYQAAEVWLEAGDWFVWYLTGARPSNRCLGRTARPVIRRCGVSKMDIRLRRS